MAWWSPSSPAERSGGSAESVVGVVLAPQEGFEFAVEVIAAHQFGLGIDEIVVLLLQRSQHLSVRVLVAHEIVETIASRERIGCSWLESNTRPVAPTSPSTRARLAAG